MHSSNDESAPPPSDDPQAKSGDETSPFTEDTKAVLSLIASEERRFRHLAYSITQNYEAARNVVLDARIRMLERDLQHRFNDADHMRAHAYTVIRHLAIDWLKKNSHEVKTVPCNDPDALSKIQRERSFIDDTDSHMSILRAMKPLLHELTENEARVFEQRFLGAEFHDIARALNMSRHTAKTHHARAVRKLRKLNRTDIKGAIS